jgi:hypothetical protein
VTDNKKQKRAAHERAKRDGTSYSTARRNMGITPPPGGNAALSSYSEDSSAWPPSASVLNSLSVWAWAALAHRVALRALPGFALPRVLDLDGTHIQAVADAVASARIVSQSPECATEDQEPTPSWRAYEASEVALYLESALGRDNPMWAAVRSSVVVACCASRAAAIHDQPWVHGSPEVCDLFSPITRDMLQGSGAEAQASAVADLRWLLENRASTGPVSDAYFNRPLWAPTEPMEHALTLNARRRSLHEFEVPHSYLGPRSINNARSTSTVEVRKGARVRFKSGLVCEMLDNRVRQYTRTVRCVTPGREEIGDVHVGDLAFVDDQGVWIPIVLTPGQAQATGLMESLVRRNA